MVVDIGQTKILQKQKSDDRIKRMFVAYDDWEMEMEI